MSAPEKIWARPDPATVYMDGSSPLMARDREFSHATEYVRADIASPAPSLPEDVARVVERLEIDAPNMPHEETERLLRDAAAIIQSISSQLTERDRLAAENASRDRLIYHLVSWIENEAGAELPLDEDQFNLACSIRAALDTAKAGEDGR